LVRAASTAAQVQEQVLNKERPASAGRLLSINVNMPDRLNPFDSFSGPTIKPFRIKKGSTCSFCVQFSSPKIILAVNVETRFRLRFGQKPITTEFISFGTVWPAIIGSKAPRFTAKNLNKSPLKAKSTGSFKAKTLSTKRLELRTALSF